MDDQVTYLSKRIEAYKKQNFQHLDNKALVDNLSWNSSRFWADILFDSKQGKNFDFVDFKINFETIHNIKIDIDELKNKFWLRSILSLPAIPKLVSNALYSLEKYITAKAEFEFVGHLNNSENNRFSIKEIEELITNYNSTTFSSIQFGNLKKTFLLVEDKTYKDKEQYIISGTFKYWTFLKAHYNELFFLKKLQECLYEENELKIPSQKFDEILKKHKALNNKLPDKQQFVDNETIVIDNEFIAIRLERSKANILEQEIATILWENCIASTKIYSDEERVVFFLKRIEPICWQLNPDLFKNESRIRFLDASLALIEKETDIYDFKNEIQKCRLDYYLGHGYEILDDPVIGGTIPVLTENNIVELYSSMETLNGPNSDIFNVQIVRTSLSFVIANIVTCDSQYSGNEKERYYYIKQLLKNWRKSPFLLWETSRAIQNHRPEILPYLIKDEMFGILSLMILEKVEISQNFTSDENRAEIDFNFQKIHQKIIIENFNLYLDQFDSFSENEQQLLMLLLRLFRKKFNANPYRTSNQRAYDRNEIFLIDTILETIANKKKKSITHSSTTKYHPSVIVKLLPGIFNEMKKTELVVSTDNGLLFFPLPEINLMIWILEIIEMQKHGVEVSGSALRKVYDDMSNELPLLILNAYLKPFELEKYKSRFLHENEEQPYHFSENQPEVELIRWEVWIEAMYNVELLESFIRPINFDLQSTLKANSAISPKKSLDDDLRLLAQKLRSHIKLLIFLEEKYALHNSKKQKHAKYIFQNLQNEIERYIKAYSKENISKGIPNIFDEKYEYGSHWNSQPILVNLITKAINRFEASSRKGVIKILVSSNKDNLKMLLILFNNMDSEADKQYISNEIKKVNVQEYLDSQYWLPNLERAMIEAANSEVFKDQALELLKFVEQRIDRQHNKHEWRRLIYRIKLLLAYYDGENEKLAQIQMPEENVHLSTSEKHLLPNDSLDFFTALVMLRQGNAITAYSIFNRLLSNNPLDVQFAVNRFAAKVKIAVSSSENDSEEGRASFSEALEEWAEYQKKSIDIDIAQSVFYEAIQYNKLVCCNALDMLAEFENCWNQLYFTKQYSNDFMKLRVDYLLKQDRKINAYDLLKNAKNYHKLYSDAYPTFFNEIEKQIENPKVIEEFRTDFKRILQLTPEKIIEVVSKNDTTGNLTVGSFLLKEINLACDSILENILSVKSVKNEDKYNDLLTLTLNSKLNFIQWTVKDQPRGGKSNTNKNNPGERDFKIEASGERIAIIEALRLNSIAQGSIESHYKKTFNYEPSRKLYYLLTYFEGTNFNAAWEKYKKMIFKIKMASDLEIDGIIEDVLPIGPHDSIKSACARLKNGGEYFHIFMNMNYLAKRD